MNGKVSLFAFFALILLTALPSNQDDLYIWTEKGCGSNATYMTSDPIPVYFKTEPGLPYELWVYRGYTPQHLLSGMGDGSIKLVSKVLGDPPGEAIFVLIMQCTAEYDDMVEYDDMPYNATAPVEMCQWGSCTVNLEKPIVTPTPNTPPECTVTADPPSGEAPLEVVFEGVATDDDGVIIAYEWDFDNDGKMDYSSITSSSASWTYSEPGTYTAVFYAYDNYGSKCNAEVQITVFPKNQPPTATLEVEPSEGEAPLQIQIKTSGEDDKEIVKYQLIVNHISEGETKEIVNNEGENPIDISKVLEGPGEYEITLTVWDAESEMDSVMKSIKVRVPSQEPPETGEVTPMQPREIPDWLLPVVIISIAAGVIGGLIFLQATPGNGETKKDQQEKECRHQFIEVKIEDWEEWHKADSKWRKGTIKRKTTCTICGKEIIEEVGELREEKKGREGTVKKQEKLKNGRTKVTKEEYRGKEATEKTIKKTTTTEYEDGKPTRTTQTDKKGNTIKVEYEDGKPTRTTQTDKKGNTIKVEYEDGKPTRTTQTDKKGKMKGEWKKEEDKWYKKMRGELKKVEKEKVPLPDKLEPVSKMDG